MKQRVSINLFAVTLFLLVINSFATAQSNNFIFLKGEVKESGTNELLVHASVIFILPDSSRTAALTNENGRFTKRLKKEENIYILVQYLGFEPIKTSLNELGGTTYGDTLQLPAFMMKPKNSVLQEVVVEASPILILNDGSKIIYQVERDSESKIATLYSILPKVPLLSLDHNQNVLLKGSSKFVILLDGKENALFAVSLQEALKSIPAASIKSIEIINDIPPRYQQANITGIINITTKGGIEGATMTLSASANVPFDTKGAAYGVLKTEKTTLVLNAGITQGNSITSLRENQVNFRPERDLTNLLTEQFNDRTNQRIIELAGSHDLDSLNLLTFSVSSIFTPKESEVLAHVNQTSFNGPITSFSQQSERFSKRQDYKLEANYENRGKRNPARLFTLLYQLEAGNENGLGEAAFLEQKNVTFNDFRQDSKFSNTQHTLDASYIFPFKQATIETGAKGISRTNKTAVLLLERQGESDIYKLNKGTSTDFSFRQNILSYFVAGNMAMGEKWRTRVVLNHDLVDEVRTENIIYNRIRFDYQNFAPSVNVTRTLTPQSNLSVNHTTHVIRPSIEQLSPLLDYTTPTLIYVGNADLPEIRNTFSLNFSQFKTSFLSVSLAYTTVKNQIQNISYNQGNTNEIDFTNIDRVRSWGLTLNNNFPLTPKLRVSSTLFGNYYTFRDEETRRGISAQGFFSMSYRANSRYSASMNYIYNGPHYTYQSQNYLTDMLYLTFNGNGFDNKLNYSISLRNPFADDRRSENQISDEAFSQNILLSQPQRSVALRVSYRFGQLKVRDIKRTEKTIENTDSKHLDPKEKIN